jgi:hypothetical protein
MINQKREPSKSNAVQFSSPQDDGITPVLQKVMVKIDLDRTSFCAGSAQGRCEG